MKTLYHNAIPILLLLFLLGSCKEARKSIEETLNPQPTKKPAASDTLTSTVLRAASEAFSVTSQLEYKSLFESAEALDSIQQELINLPHLKGKKLHFFLGFFFYDFHGGMISINLQDPDQPENIDTYTYTNGEWQPQKPMKITGNLPLKSLLMPLEEVKFSTAKKVYDIGLEKSKSIEGAAPITHVYFNQMKVVHVKEWYIMINGTRRNYQVKFDVNGRLVAMTK